MGQLIILLFHPGMMLLFGIIVLAMLLWLFRPGKGVLARLSKIRRNNRRVLLEDPLKYIFDCGYRDQVCGLNDLAGNLNIPTDQCSQLIERLNALGLISEHERTTSLTNKSRSNALRVIRVHHIWENYLADETGLEPAEWHREADTLEHQVTEQDIEELAARMGHPVFDPHGDPIPTSVGELPSLKGKPLSQLKKGEIGRITHIEEVARNFILFGQQDVTVVVVDATRLERNLNLVLQILEITNRAVLCLNLMDEAKRNHIEIDVKTLSKELGIPVIPASARSRKGINELLGAIDEVATGKYVCRPHQLKSQSSRLNQAMDDMAARLSERFPDLPNVQWVAPRLLEGDDSIIEAVRSGELGSIRETGQVSQTVTE